MISLLPASPDCLSLVIELFQAAVVTGGNVKKSMVILVVVLMAIVLFAGCGSSGS